MKKRLSPGLVKNIRMHGARNSRGMRRTVSVHAMTKDERNTADGCFSTALLNKFNPACCACLLNNLTDNIRLFLEAF